MLLGFGLNHSHYTASKGINGVYTTVSVDEVIVFPLQLNVIEITALDTNLEIYFNNDLDAMYISAGDSDGISALPVNRITVKGPVGQKIKWRALVGINNT